MAILECNLAGCSMNRLVSVKLHRVDTIHKVDEWQETLYTYDHRGLVKTEVNAAGDGKIYVYDGNGNLVEETDEDGYVTKYAYSPVNLVSEINSKSQSPEAIEKAFIIHHPV